MVPRRIGLIVLIALGSMGACVGVPARESIAPTTVAGAMGARPFWAGQDLTVAERFEIAKQSQPALIAFLRRMPKGADLHNHVSGAGYSDDLLAAVADKKLNYDLTTDLFTHDIPVPGKIVSIDDLKSHPDMLARFLDAYSMRGWHPNTGNGHDHFFHTFPRMDSAQVDNNVLLVDIIKRNLYQNVQYLELMTKVAPPDVTDDFMRRLQGFDANDLPGAFRAVQPLIADKKIKARIKAFLDERDEYINSENRLLSGERARINGDDPDLVVRYLPQLHRSDNLRKFFATAVVSMLAINSDARVVGLNVVGAEDDPRAREGFEDQMKVLDFLWQRMDHPHITLHAGELVLRESPVEPMRNRIRRSIERGHALRIGHGISVGWDDDVAGLLGMMQEKGILVEICLSSNEAILGVQGDAHPFALYRAAGVPVSLNTDDEGVGRSNLTMEYVKAVERYGLHYADVQELARNSLEYSFLPGAGLYQHHDYSRPRAEFESVRDRNWQPTAAARRLMRVDEKLRRQVHLERAMVEFEQYLEAGFAERRP